MNIRKVAFISPELPYVNLVSHCVFPEYGVPLVATIVRDAGYEVDLFVESVGPIQWDKVLSADVACFHAFSSTMPKTIDYINRIKDSRPDMPIVIGGTHASVMVEDTLQYCDAVIRQEGDESLLEVLERWEQDEGLAGVLGVSYWDQGRMRHNQARPFVQEFETIPDLELIHDYLKWPKWKLLLNLKMRWQVLQTSRGCPYDCSFCVAPRELGRGYRTRSIDAVIKDIKYQQSLAGTQKFFLVDNHFTVQRDRTKDLLRRIIAEQIPWYALCFTRLEVARDEELLALLMEAKIKTLYIGLESFDNRVLKLLNKNQNSDGMRQSLAKIKRHGLKVLGSFVLGSDDDDVHSIRATVNSAIEADVDYVGLFPLSGYPEENSPTIPINRFLLPSWDRLDGQFVMFLPKNMKPSTLQEEINRAYKKFYGPRQILRRVFDGDFNAAYNRLLYTFRVWEMRRSTNKWIKYLKKVEGPFYDENERLKEETLGEGIHPAKFPGNSRGAGVEWATIGAGPKISANQSAHHQELPVLSRTSSAV